MATGNNQFVKFRAKPDKQNRIKAAALAAGVSQSAWIMRLIDAELDKKVNVAASTAKALILPAEPTYRRFAKPGALLKK